MKVFFFYIGTPSPIFETELELIRKHEKAGDLVRIIQCSGSLSNCHWNLNHIDSQCAICRSRFKNGWEAINPGGGVELKQFPPREEMNSNTPLVFDTVDDINKYRYDNEKIGFGVTASLISTLRDHRFDTQKYRKEVFRGLSTAMQVYKTLKIELKEFDPDQVYFFNGRILTHLPAKLLCKKLGIEHYSYEVSRLNNSYRLLKNKTNHDVISDEVADQLSFSWTLKNKEIAVSILKKMRDGSDLGKAKIFTQEQRQGVLPEGFNIQKRNIAIFSGTIDEYAGIENAKGKIYKPDETEGIYRILESFEANSNFFFYIRVHPHMKELPRTTSQLVDIQKLISRFNNVCVIWPEDYVDSYSMIDACEKVITFGSTVGIEATYWGKPSILADRAKFQNFNYAYMPKTHDELVNLIYTNLKPMSSDSAEKIIYLLSYDGAPFEYFKETKDKSGNTKMTLDGVEIKANTLPILCHWLYLFPSRLLRIIKKPSRLLRVINL
jgi:hypothetical protein